MIWFKLCHSKFFVALISDTSMRTWYGHDMVGTTTNCNLLTVKPVIWIQKTPTKENIIGLNTVSNAQKVSAKQTNDKHFSHGCNLQYNRVTIFSCNPLS